MLIKKNFKKLGALFLAATMFVGSVNLSTLSALAQDDGSNGNGLKILSSEWPDFRGNANNMGITSTKTPIDAGAASLKWARRVGQGVSSSAVSSPIIVDGKMVAYAGTNLYKFDLETGEILACQEMAAASSFAINPPAYADGMIFVGLSSGRVQAFNAETLEPLWLFQDDKKGQPNSTIKYNNGYIYTGFWNSERKEANFSCVDVRDEDPTNKYETKKAVWSHAAQGGYYWAGAYVNDKVAVVGTDDGESGWTSTTSSLLSLDKKTGEVVDSLTGEFTGDIRCDMAYNESDGRIYFTSKGGYLYSIKLLADGKFEHDSLKSLKIGGMSTSTPIVYNNRVYVGIGSEDGNFAKTGHYLGVVNVAEDGSLSFAYKYETNGYPQTSGLLTTGYEAETGYVYVYFCYNNLPGGVYCIKDKAGQTTPDVYPIFEPTGDKQQYAICSPIADSNGVLYYKNDSAYMMAIETNAAEIADVKVEGGVLNKGNGFIPEQRDNDIVLEENAQNVKISVTPKDGTEVTIDGQNTNTLDVAVVDNSVKTIEVVAKKGEYTKTYTFNIRGKSSNTALKNLSAYTGAITDNLALTLSPALSDDVSEYKLATSSEFVKSIILNVNLSDSNASLALYPVSGVNTSSTSMNKTTGEIKAAANTSYKYTIKTVSGADEAVVKAVVTAEDGKTSKEYNITLKQKEELPKTIVTVNVAGQMANAYLMAPADLEVYSGLAKEYGFSYAENVKADEVTTLDVLVAYHAAVFGDAFTKENADEYLKVSSSGFITKAFGEDNIPFSFTVNGYMPNDGKYEGQYGATGYNINQAVVKESDKVEFLVYSDTTGWSDNYTYFTKDGKRTDEITVPVNEDVTLNLKGFSLAYYGTCEPESEKQHITDIEDAQIAIVKDGVASAVEGAITNEKGNAKVKFDTVGSVNVTALSTKDMTAPIFMPSLTVNVVSTAEYYKAAYEEVTQKINAIGEVELSKESKALIDDARKAYDALSDLAKKEFSADTLKVLTDAEAKYNELKEAKEKEDKDAANKVVKLIEEIGNVDASDECKERINNARKAYETLTDEQKALVTNLETLEQNEATFKEVRVQAKAVTLNAKVQKGYEYLRADASYKVIPGLAKKYGFSYDKMVTEDDVTALDVLVALHEAVYGDAFTKETVGDYLMVSSSGVIQKMFKEKTTAVGFAVNGEMPNDGKYEGTYGAMGYLINQAIVKANDKVEFFFYQDTDMWMDKYTYFTKDGQMTDSLTAVANEEITLNLVGYYYAFCGTYKPGSPQQGVDVIENAQIVIVDKDGKVTKVDNAITDKNGNAKLTLKEAGEYNISAIGATSTADKIIMPTLKLNVLSVKEYYKDVIDNVNNKINAIGTVALTDESKALIDDARKAYDALTDNQKTAISADTLKVLTDAEAEYTKLKEAKEAEEAKIAKDKEEAAKADDAIKAIGNVSLTDESKALIDAARKAYDALTTDQKAYVKELKTLETAEAEYVKLKEAKEAEEAKIAKDKEEAAKADDAIKAIGEVAATKESGNLIETARRAYNNLTEDQKAYVTQLPALEAAEKAYIELTTVSGISLAAKSATLYVGQNVSLKPVVTPSTAFNKTVEFISSNEKVVTVTKQGLVKAVAAGKAVITVKTVDQGLTAKFSVTVKANTITLNKTKATLYTRGAKKLTLKATVRGLKSTVKWTSSNTKIATVKNGVVTAIKTGRVTITAKANGKVAKCTITVLAPTLKVNKQKVTLKVNGKVKLTVTATPATKITYKSSNKNVVKVDAKGNITAVKKGTATITVKANGLTKTVRVTVK
ncbi:Outer membrane protein assembly factor BamB, contains PQQ-like beta-propeller repeat [Acetitomaculum ruminis DSM 5522]|uniref:Outer membrane protein assembly factor BamB, contains PQQ-like beta-propeller repeat n=1 Tax=Acetitomaculum ruminis DSM 5522 TaxID=1120918 RepID=A0A1I0W7Q3_9FIRM|nr:Ig-like domain-containing protein [Acetitomaculum ruminis]SFA84328.1 Outer membrane protein assembly factor BamB, contains PQQ-like beta-propeller repeat [Acetitomaculum ruminis DSM 5522]